MARIFNIRSVIGYADTNSHLVMKSLSRSSATGEFYFIMHTDLYAYKTYERRIISFCFFIFFNISLLFFLLNVHALRMVGPIDLDGPSEKP